jgi:hypothetical protein
MADKIEMIAYCGLYCGECPNHTGKIADLSRDLRKELRSVRFDKTAESLSELSFFNMFKDYENAAREKNLKDAGFVMNLRPVKNYKN